MLYIEQPIRVGYSKGTNQDETENISDQSSSLDNLVAL